MFSFTKNSSNQYIIKCSLQSLTQSIDSWLCGFDLFELIYKMHSPNIYEQCYIEKFASNTNVATITVVYKHLLQQWGLPQKFSKMHVCREQINDNCIQFNCTQLQDDEFAAKHNVIAVNINSMTITCMRNSEEVNSWTIEIITGVKDTREPEFIEEIIKKVVKSMYSNLIAFFNM